jgi:hypothetical protein
MSTATNILSAIGAGLTGRQRAAQDFREFRAREAELAASREERIAERERQEKSDALHRALLERQVNDAPRQEAMSKLDASIKLRGIEATLDDPTTLALATSAGINLPTRDVVKPGLSADGRSWFSTEGAQRENKGVFEHSGVIKPPEIERQEVERDKAVEQARLMTEWLKGMSSPGRGGVGNLESDPNGRFMFNMVTGKSPNSIWGPVRETAAQDAERAAAVARARLPYQQQLIREAQGQRDQATGDPYFNSMINVLTAINPYAPPEQIAAKARELAAAAQAQQPRGTASVALPAPGGKPRAAAQPPPSMDSLIAQAVSTFGSIDAAIQKSSDPQVQQKLKAAGIDPAAYLRRMQAMKILEKLGK